MTKGELVAMLEEVDDDVDVLMAHQSNYPLVSRVKGVVLLDRDNEAVEGYEEYLGKKGKVVFLLEGANLGYGNSDWWYNV